MCLGMLFRFVLGYFREQPCPDVAVGVDGA